MEAEPKDSESDDPENDGVKYLELNQDKTKSN